MLASYVCFCSFYASSSSLTLVFSAVSPQAAMCYVHVAALIAEYLHRKSKSTRSSIQRLVSFLFAVLFTVKWFKYQSFGLFASCFLSHKWSVFHLMNKEKNRKIKTVFIQLLETDMSCVLP